MGNYWKGISDERLVEVELELLALGGLDPTEIQIEDVKLPGYENDPELYMHTL